ncbi:MAG: FAD-dependent oxidoreductase [bacterium]
MTRVDAVVVGAGAMGAATAWHLARRGRSVVLLEQFSRGHLRGSSHGATRIFRVAYRDPLYSRLAGRAIPMWRELEAAAGETLLEQTGQLDHGEPVAIDEIEFALRDGGWAYERLTPAAAHERWPGLVFDREVIYSPDGGRVFADRTVEALTRLAESEGTDVRFETPATALRVGHSGVTVQTPAGEWEAATVVVAAGAWLDRLPGLEVPLPEVRATAQQPVHFPIRPGYSFPSYVHHVGTDAIGHTFAYGAYGLESPGEGVKLGLDTEEDVDPDVEAGNSAEALADAVDDAERWLPGADTSQVSAVRCLFTMTPDSNFILDRRGSVVVCSPCSGHGFMFAPLIGSIAADLVEGRDHGTAPWRLPAA